MRPPARIPARRGGGERHAAGRRNPRGTDVKALKHDVARSLAFSSRAHEDRERRVFVAPESVAPHDLNVRRLARLRALPPALPACHCHGARHARRDEPRVADRRGPRRRRTDDAEGDPRAGASRCRAGRRPGESRRAAIRARRCAGRLCRQTRRTSVHAAGRHRRADARACAGRAQRRAAERRRSVRVRPGRRRTAGAACGGHRGGSDQRHHGGYRGARDDRHSGHAPRLRAGRGVRHRTRRGQTANRTGPRSSPPA